MSSKYLYLCTNIHFESISPSISNNRFLIKLRIEKRLKQFFFYRHHLGSPRNPRVATDLNKYDLPENFLVSRWVSPTLNIQDHTYTASVTKDKYGSMSQQRLLRLFEYSWFFFATSALDCRASPTYCIKE